MSRKAILNVSSTKKRNGMLTWSNTASNGDNVPVAQQAAYVRASSPNKGFFFWNATAMDLITDAEPNNSINTSQRTATTCYMRGLSEHIQISTSSGLPWFWRRICFTLKEDLDYADEDGTPPIPPANYVDTSNGMQRLLFNDSVNSTPLYQQRIAALIFKGVAGKDWNNITLAPLDTSRITVKYDKTKTIKSGNQVGTHREFKVWHPMNHNLVYGDDEDGATMDTAYTSVTSKAGMGNYFILDIVNPLQDQGADTDTIRIDINSTLYWHEK